MDSNDNLRQQALDPGDRRRRREAFLSLLRSEDWAQALDPELIGVQGYLVRGEHYPDMLTFQEAAPLIAASDDRLQRVLELLGSPFSGDLLMAVARSMGPELLDAALPHLRTARGDRAELLMQALQQADPTWVTRRAARRVIRRQLVSNDQGRSWLMNALAEAGGLAEFLEQIHHQPPTFLEEWRALGKAGIVDQLLVDLALASLRFGPEPLTYLLRLDPLPEGVASRVMAAARLDWLVELLEVAVMERLVHPLLVPVAELGVRLGGRPMAMASSWLGTARVTKQLLACLAPLIQREDDQDQIDDLLWVRRRVPSADRAMDALHAGQAPEPGDSAALVRQLSGEEAADLAQEIIEHPWPEGMQPLLRDLCALNREAARRVTDLAEDGEPGPARRALQALEFPDVFWE